MPNCVATPLSRAQIRNMAGVIRKIEGTEDKCYFDIVHFVEVTLSKIDPDFSLIIEPKEQMGSCHGLTYPDKNEIHLREDVYNLAVDGSGRDRLTIAHELFHLLQHCHENISFARMREECDIPAYMNPEWQADAFGGELLIPRDLIRGMSVEEIVNSCKVSKAAAMFQMRYV